MFCNHVFDFANAAGALSLSEMPRLLPVAVALNLDSMNNVQTLRLSMYLAVSVIFKCNLTSSSTLLYWMFDGIAWARGLFSRFPISLIAFLGNGSSPLSVRSSDDPRIFFSLPEQSAVLAPGVV